MSDKYGENSWRKVSSNSSSRKPKYYSDKNKYKNDIKYINPVQIRENNFKFLEKSIKNYFKYKQEQSDKFNIDSFIEEIYTKTKEKLCYKNIYCTDIDIKRINDIDDEISQIEEQIDADNSMKSLFSLKKEKTKLQNNLEFLKTKIKNKDIHSFIFLYSMPTYNKDIIFKSFDILAKKSDISPLLILNQHNYNIWHILAFPYNNVKLTSEIIIDVINFVKNLETENMKGKKIKCKIKLFSVNDKGETGFNAITHNNKLSDELKNCFLNQIMDIDKEQSTCIFTNVINKISDNIDDILKMFSTLKTNHNLISEYTEKYKIHGDYNFPDSTAIVIPEILLAIISKPEVCIWNLLSILGNTTVSGDSFSNRIRNIITFINYIIDEINIDNIPCLEYIISHKEMFISNEYERIDKDKRKIKDLENQQYYEKDKKKLNSIRKDISNLKKSIDRHYRNIKLIPERINNLKVLYTYILENKREELVIAKNFINYFFEFINKQEELILSILNNIDDIMDSSLHYKDIIDKCYIKGIINYFMDTCEKRKEQRIKNNISHEEKDKQIKQEKNYLTKKLEIHLRNISRIKGEIIKQNNISNSLRFQDFNKTDSIIDVHRYIDYLIQSKTFNSNSWYDIYTVPSIFKQKDGKTIMNALISVKIETFLDNNTHGKQHSELLKTFKEASEGKFI